MQRVAEGFPNQIHLVVPPKVVEQALREPVTRDLLPTAVGYYPSASGHYIARERGAAEHIAILCVDGSGWVEKRGQRWPLQAGALAVLPPREPHRYGADGEPWTIYWAHFAGRMAADYAGLAGPTDGQPGVLAATGPAAVGIENLLHTLRRGYGRIELVGASTGLAAWFGIVHRLRAEARAAGENSATRLLAAAEWLRARLAERVTVEEMARVAGLSPSHFSTLFRARLGYSPLDFHLRLRVQRSCELLANSGVRVAEAGAAVGFADPLYFSRVFRRIMGEPPSAYAARQKFR